MMEKWYTRIALLVVLLVGCWVNLNLKLYNEVDRVIEHDAHSYYAYLPAIFIYDDIKLEKSSYQMEPYYYLFWPAYSEDGKAYIKTTCGLSILYSPFFFLGHWTAPVLGFEQNGYSPPYKVFLIFGGLFYMLLGLDFVRRVLQHFKVSNLTIGIVILLLGLGTNLFCYGTQSATHTHVYNFFLVSVFVWITIKWHETKSFKNTAFIGLTLGLLSLIRPTNILLAIFFALYGVGSIKALIERIQLLLKLWWKVLIMMVFAVLVWTPQVWYWKGVLGEYLFFSYAGERFFFDSPEIWKGLFSFQKGWFIYTPIMLFAVAGLFVKTKMIQHMRLSIGVFMTIIIYITFSWWCWWYGGTFGQRPMIDFYCLMAIPLAAFVQFVLERKKWMKIGLASLAGFFIWLNILQTFQFEEGSLHHDAMTRKAYFAGFGKLEKVDKFYELLVYPDYEKARVRGEKLFVGDDFAVKSKKNVFLRMDNGLYLSSDLKPNRDVWLNKEHAYDWEKFTLVFLEEGKVVITDHQGSYVSGNVEVNHGLLRTVDAPTEDCLFELIEQDGKHALQHASGAFISGINTNNQKAQLVGGITKASAFEVIAR